MTLTRRTILQLMAAAPLIPRAHLLPSPMRDVRRVMISEGLWAVMAQRGNDCFMDLVAVYPEGIQVVSSATEGSWPARMYRIDPTDDSPILS